MSSPASWACGHHRSPASCQRRQLLWASCKIWFSDTSEKHNSAAWRLEYKQKRKNSTYNSTAQPNCVLKALFWGSRPDACTLKLAGMSVYYYTTQCIWQISKCRASSLRLVSVTECSAGAITALYPCSVEGNRMLYPLSTHLAQHSAVVSGPNSRDAAYLPTTCAQEKQRTHQLLWFWVNLWLTTHQLIWFTSWWRISYSDFESLYMSDSASSHLMHFITNDASAQLILVTSKLAMQQLIWSESPHGWPFSC